MKVALVHDWLTGMRGGEKVLEAFCQIFPDAPVYTLVHVPGSVSPVIESRPIHTSFVQKLPGASEKYQRYLPIFPTAIERFDLRGYDLVLSSSHCVAKGAIVHPGTKHLCYCHTPMRYVWSAYEEYFGSDRVKPPASWILPFVANYLRTWDLAANVRVDSWAANSGHVRRRIDRFYGRKARVIYPPVDVDFYTPAGDRGDFYLIVTALVPYKRVDLVLQAVQQSSRNVIVVGDGIERARLQAMAPATVKFLGWQEPDELRELYRTCRALLFPGEEDFGIVPVEAQACGAPVIGYGRGGLLETVREGKSGVLFLDPTAESLLEAWERFESSTFSEKEIRDGVLRFGTERFADEISDWIEADGPPTALFSGDLASGAGPGLTLVPSGSSSP